MPGARLDPDELEGCSEGYKGVQCSACSSGWFSGGGDVCLPCGGEAEAAARVGGACLGVLVVVTVFLLRTGKAKSVDNPARQGAKELGPRLLLLRSSGESAGRRGDGASGGHTPGKDPGPAPLSLSPTLLMKIVFAHLQTVAIAAGVQLEWPGAVRAMFSVVDAASCPSPSRCRGPDGHPGAVRPGVRGGSPAGLVRGGAEGGGGVLLPP